MSFPIKTYLLLFLLIPAAQCLAQLSVRDTSFDSALQVDSLNTSSVDYKTVPGIVQIQKGEKENLAKGRFAYLVYTGAYATDTNYRNALRLLDGKFSSPSYVIIPSLLAGGQTGTYIMIDLQAVRSLKRVQMYNIGSKNTYPQAYSIFVGVDTLAMEKVYQETRGDTVLQVGQTVPIVTANFDPKSARFVKIVLDVISQSYSTVLSEIEVYGTGYLPTGTYTSSVRKMPKSVNFGSVEYKGSNPPKTGIYFSFRTGNTAVVDTSWSDWSPEVAGFSDLFEAYEPRSYMQYAIRLTTDTLVTPYVDEIKINYDTAVVCSSMLASISPQSAQTLKEQEFTLSIQATFGAGDLGIDTLRFRTPSPIKMNSVRVNGVAVPYTADVAFADARLAFQNTITSTSLIEISFRMTPFLDNKPHTLFASSKLVARNPQRADSKVSSRVEAWSVLTVGVPDKLLNGVKPTKNPFSPNGDGINDETAIEFFIGNIAEPSSIIPAEVRNLTVKIFDLTGRLVRVMYDGSVRASAFIGSNGIVWDGRDAGGSIVRPGVYLYQISVDSDNGGEQITKTIVVAY